MTKVILTSSNDLKKLLLELQSDEDIDVVYENKPLSYPCMAVHYYSDDVDFGGNYQICFVYSSDFK